MKLNSFNLFLLAGILTCIQACNKKGCIDPNSLAYNKEAKKDDGSCTYPTSVKRALVFKETGTWCGYCGEWGTTYANNLSASSPNIQVMELHLSDAFESPIGVKIMEALGPVNSVPHFFVGTSNVSNSYNTLLNAVNTELAEANEVALALTSSVSGTTMTVDVQAQWQSVSNTHGDYYLAVYVLEDGQVAPQNVQGAPQDQTRVHNHVLRSEASDQPFGKQIVVKGDGFRESFQISLSGTWVPGNCYPVAVLWKKNGASYEFINLVGK